MKKIGIYILLISMSLFMGCESNKSDSFNSEKQVEVIKESIDENTQMESNKDIVEMYSNLENDKEYLKYNVLDKVNYYYETEDNLVGMRLLDQLPKINDKKYGDILNAYSFASLSTRVSMKYEKALEYVKKVLPDDIKMEREKFNQEMGSIHIFYSSSKGNFVANLNCENSIYKDGKYVYDRATISGISYMKEIID